MLLYVDALLYYHNNNDNNNNNKGCTSELCTEFSPICCAASVTLCCVFVASSCCCGCHSAAAAAVVVVLLVALQKCKKTKTIEHIVHLHKHTQYVHTHIRTLNEHIVSACIHKCYTHTHTYICSHERTCAGPHDYRLSYQFLAAYGSASAWTALLTSQCLLAQNNFRYVFLVFSLLFPLIVRSLMQLIFAFSH